MVLSSQAECLYKTTDYWIAEDQHCMIWNDPQIATVDIQYADLRPSKGLALTLQAKGRLKTMFTKEQIESAREMISVEPDDFEQQFAG